MQNQCLEQFSAKIFVQDDSESSHLRDDMWTVSKNISNTKRESVTNDLFSHAGEVMKKIGGYYSQ